MKPCLAFSVLILLFACSLEATSQPGPYQPIKIQEIFSQLITRDKADRIYSGQIKSKAGLAEFEKAYGINLGKQDIDFDKQMFIFGVTDNITTRVFQLLEQENGRSFILDYADTGIEYKLLKPEEGKKYSYLQVFILNRIDGISHIKAKNLVENGLSKIYDL